MEPSRWVRLDVAGEVLSSLVEATGAPLPLAPPFQAHVAVRVGDADDMGPTVTAVLRARGAAPSNAFGTLKAAPYHLIDLNARVPLADHLAVALAVENVLDAKDARDANQLPLPGRLLFVSLEVRG